MKINIIPNYYLHGKYMLALITHEVFFIPEKLHCGRSNYSSYHIERGTDSSSYLRWVTVIHFRNFFYHCSFNERLPFSDKIYHLLPDTESSFPISHVLGKVSLV